MKNIHVLPTDIFNQLGVDHYGKTPTQIKIAEFLINKNIYITSDEEINKDTKTCWCIDISCNELVLYQGVLPSYHYKHYKKIIMTTDNSINVLCSCGKDCGAKESGVQAIDDEFLEWFVKNPSCDRVHIGGILKEGSNNGYEIILPKETPEQHVELINNNNEDFDKAVESFKQKKLKQERMYSEEEVIAFGEFIFKHSLLTYTKGVKSLFEQFKKK